MLTIVCFMITFSEGEVISILKTIKEAENLSQEEAAQIAASRIHDSKPKSRMYYKIGASRKIGGSKKVDPKSFLTDKLKALKKLMLEIIFTYRQIIRAS